MRRLLEYLELVLTAAGVVVIGAVFAIFRDLSPWKAAAISAVLVGILHGLIFFAVRSAQRKARNRDVHVIRGKLEELMRDKLQLILWTSEAGEQGWRDFVQQTAVEIGSSLSRIETEALLGPKAATSQELKAVGKGSGVQAS